MQQLQNRLVLIYVLVAAGYLLLALSFYWSGFRPLAERLKLEHRNEVSYAMDATKALIEGIVQRHLALARQTSSRSAIREAQARYLSGEMSRQAFEAFSLDKLADALGANSEMLAIIRHAPDGEILLQVGPAPPEDWFTSCRTTQPGQSALIGPVKIEHELILLYCASIDSPIAGHVGFDLIFMHSTPVQQVLEQPQYHDARTITFGLADRDGQLSLWPDTDEALSARRDLLQSHISRAQPMPAGYSVESRPIASAELVLYAVVDEQEFFAHINRQLLRWLGVLAFWGVVVLLLTLLALQRLLKGAVEVKVLTHQTRRDGMTGLYNHEHMGQLLDIEIARNRRYGSGFSLLMFDLDHFKTVNDRHGHPVGDQVLKTVADILRRLARSTDHLARYGGEEFMLIMPETDPEGALQMAERLRGEMGSTAHHASGVEFFVTISVGIVSCPQGVPSPDRRELIKLVDDALYASKGRGRNRVTQQVLPVGQDPNAAAASPSVTKQRLA